MGKYLYTSHFFFFSLITCAIIIIWVIIGWSIHPLFSLSVDDSATGASKRNNKEKHRDRWGNKEELIFYAMGGMKTYCFHSGIRSSLSFLPNPTIATKQGMEETCNCHTCGKKGIDCALKTYCNFSQDEGIITAANNLM